MGSIPAAPAVSYEDVIELWIAERTNAKQPPRPKAITARRTKLKRFFDWLGRGTDMASVTLADLQRYKESLMHQPGGIAFDHLAETKTTYRFADRNNRFLNGNPADKLVVPKKPPHEERRAFTDEEAARILIAARSADPLVRWANWLAAFTDTITEEIVGARREDFYQIGDIWVFDMTGRTLKSAFRSRGLPLHSALVREGFTDWLASLPAGPVFEDSDPTRASAALMRFIRSQGITDRNAVFYSWRHRVITQLEDVTTPDRARFIAGHSAKDVHAKHYLHHQLPQLIAAIEGLADPTA